MCVCVGCQLNSAQALRLLCFNRHVRARGSMLWGHHLTRSERIVVYWKSSFRGSSATKITVQTPQKCCLLRATHVSFLNFRAETKSCLITEFIAELIRGETFWEVVCFTGQHSGPKFFCMTVTSLNLAGLFDWRWFKLWSTKFLEAELDALFTRFC